MSSPWFPYTPDRDRPDPHASPVRYDYLSRDEQEVRQALADWFQISPATSETRNLHTAESLLGDILSKLPLDGDGMDPELLRAGWLKAAGPFLGQQSNLLSIVKGVATIQVLQPALPSPAVAGSPAGKTEGPVRQRRRSFHPHTDRIILYCVKCFLLQFLCFLEKSFIIHV